MRLRHVVALAALLATMLGNLGCARTINRAAERRIRDVLPEIIGPAKRYVVRVEGAPERTLQGRLRSVAIDGEDVRYKNGLLMDHIRLDLKGVEADTSEKRLRKIKETRFEITIGEANLNEFLVDEVIDGERLRDIRVRLHENQVVVTGKRVTLGLGAPFEMAGPLRLKGPTLIELDPTRLKVAGIPFSGKILAFLKRRIEASADLSEFSFPIVLSEVRTEQGKLILRGSAVINSLIGTIQARMTW